MPTEGVRRALVILHAEREGPISHAVPGWVDSFVFGQVWDRPGRGESERTPTAITMLAATERPAQCACPFGARDNGASPAAIPEVVAMLAAYAGFPAALNALRLWQDVFRSAAAQGIRVD